MEHKQLLPFDLTAPAENGMRRGITTGTCAAAAVKAAVCLLEFGVKSNEIAVTLPSGEHFVVVPVCRVELDSTTGGASAFVVKDAGDDPDHTNGATIFASVRRNAMDRVRFIAGEGVGMVTEPGIRVAVGEPAINPGPRAMIERAIEEAVEGEIRGYDVVIGCENGEQIARRTFNPRLGITGGISILGTTGIVEPMSLSAYKASIEVYIRVALAGEAGAVAFMPGNIGLGFARGVLDLPKKRIVQISNFIGFSLDCAEEILEQDNARLNTLWVLGHPGKLAKVLDGYWDTHSARSAMAMSTMARVARECGFSEATCQSMDSSNTVEAIVDMLHGQAGERSLWLEVEGRVSREMTAKVGRANRVEVRLFGMDGHALGGAA